MSPFEIGLTELPLLSTKITFSKSIKKNEAVIERKKRLILGNKNSVGKNIEKLRKERGFKQKDFIAKLQVAGLDINPTSYSKLEGQLRIATDKEVYTIAKVLGVKMEDLY